VFEWDEEKARANLAEHGVSFEEAQLVFFDQNSVSEIDDRYDYGEVRWRTIGMLEGRCMMLSVAHTTSENGTVVIRIINARRANRKEWRRYGNRKVQG